MRICLFTPTFYPRVGGAEAVVDALARQFQALGHEPIVLAPRMAGTEALELPYEVQRYRKPVWPQWFPERIEGALERLHRRRPLDVVAVSYGQPTGYAAIRFRERRDVPTVLICHGGDLYRNGKTRRKPHRWRRTVAAYQQADGVVSISPYTDALIREIAPAPARLTRIGNGVDPDAVTAPAPRPADYPDTRPFCLCLGNLIPQKGFDDAIDAFAEARADLNDLQLVIVGGGKLAPELKQRAADSGAGEHIHFMGERTGADKRWFLQHCAFGMMPSREEAFGLVALEFLAADKPLICTTSPAFDAMYAHGVNGWRVPPRDSAALAEAMRRVHQGALGDVSAANAQRLDQFTWPAIAEQYLALFEQVIAARRGG